MSSELTHFLISTTIEFLVLVFVGYEVVVGEIRHRRNAQTVTSGLPESVPRSLLGMRTGLFIVLITGAIWVLAAATYFAVTPSISINQTQAEAPAIPADITELIKSLRSQLNTAKQDLVGVKRELEKTKGELDAARHPPISPDKTPTWLELAFDGEGKPTENASTNVHWAWWNPVEPGYDPLGIGRPLGILGSGTTTAQPATTLIFLSFDSPIRYNDVFVKGKEGLPSWEIRQKTDKTAVVWIHGKITNAALWIEILK